MAPVADRQSRGPLLLNSAITWPGWCLLSYIFLTRGNLIRALGKTAESRTCLAAIAQTTTLLHVSVVL